MKKVFRRVLSIALALAMILAWAPASVFHAQAEEVLLYDENSASWPALTATTGTVAAGMYKLTAPLTLTGTLTVAKNTQVVLDLNGYSITALTGKSAFSVSGNLIIQDSSAAQTGTVYGAALTGARGGCVTIGNASAEFALYSGTLTGGSTNERGGNINVGSGTCTIWGGTVSNGSAVDYGGNIYVTGMTSDLNIYGGTISGGNCGTGGNVSLMYANLNMTAGTITDGVGKYANLYATGYSQRYPTINISGGTITKGNTYLNGNLSDNTAPVVNISGGVFEGETYVYAATALSLSGAPVMADLRLGNGVVMRLGEMTQGASVTVNPNVKDAPLTSALADPASYVPYFHAYHSGYAVGVSGNTLIYTDKLCPCGCGAAKDTVQWQDLNAYVATLTGDDPEFREEGHYYLSGNLDLATLNTTSKTLEIYSTVVLDLRGKTITPATDSRTVFVNENASFTLMDTKGGGTLIGGSVTGNGGAIFVTKTAHFTMLGGTITGGSATSYGGNIYMTTSTEVNLLGGTVEYGTATDSGRGGNIYVGAGTLTIGGTAKITGGTARYSSGTSGRGGNIFMAGGSATITGSAQITNGVADKYAGNIMITGCSLTVTGNARITGGNSGGNNGDNIVNMYGDLTVGENAIIDAGAENACETSVLITGTESGGNGTLTLTGGTIKGKTDIGTYVESIEISGKPVVENLSLASGKLLTLGQMSSGASVTVKTGSSDGVITGELVDAESYVPYFHAVESGKAVGVSGNVLAVVEGCAHCGSQVTWTDWNGEAITESGHYRLQKSVSSASLLTIASGLDVTIDLNGLSYAAASGNRAFTVAGTLNIVDTAGGGTLTGSTLVGAHGGTVYVDKGGVLNLYSGTITDGKVRLLVTTTSDFAYYLNQYDIKTIARGGNVFVRSGGSFNMYGGTVSNGQAKGVKADGKAEKTNRYHDDSRGGNLYVEGSFNMYGGTISGGDSKRGGNIATTGPLKLMGGTIQNGTTSDGDYGENIITTGTTVNVYLDGTTVKNGSIFTMYSCLHVGKSTLTSDVPIEMTRTSNFSTLYVYEGANIAGTISAGGTTGGKSDVVVIYGGTVTGKMDIKKADAVIITGAPVISNMTLGSGVLVSPVNMTQGASVTVNPAATGVFTNEFDHADDYAGYFHTSDASHDVISVGNALSVDVIEASGNCGTDETGENVTWQITESGILVISGTGAMADYTGYDQTPWALAGVAKGSITKVVVCSGVTTLSNYGFDGCSKLASVSLPEGLTRIGTCALRSTAITEIQIPSTVTAITGTAFSRCTGLTEITLPSGLTSINKNLFNGCTGITEILIPDQVETIGEGAFLNSGVKVATIPVSVTTINADAFPTGLQTVYYAGSRAQWEEININESNTGLNGATIHFGFVAAADPGSAIEWDITGSTLTVSGFGAMPNYLDQGLIGYCSAPWAPYADTVTAVIVDGFSTVGSWAFANMKNLTSVDLGLVESIGDNAFRGCSALTTVEGATGFISSIGVGAFMDCTSLKSTCIDTELETIGEFAFYNSGITSAKLYEQVVQIGDQAFGSCAALTEIKVESGNTHYKSVSGALLSKDGATLIQVPGGCAGAYTVPATVTEIAPYAVADCDQLTAVTVPDSVQTIGGAAFDDCDGLTTVTLGSGVTAVESNAFAACDQLTGFVVAEGNTTYAADATGALCSKDLTTLYQAPAAGATGNYTVSDTVKTVATGALAQNATLQTLTLPAGVTKLEARAISCNPNMTTLTVYPGVTEYPKGALECTGLTDVYYMGKQTQWNKVTVSSYNAPLAAATVHCTVVDTGTFTYTTKENNVTVTLGSHSWSLDTDGVLTITGTGIIRDFAANTMPWYAYLGQITKVVVQEGTTVIGTNAFNGCSALTSVTLPATLTAVNANAFAGCDAMTEGIYNGTDWAEVTVAAEGNMALVMLFRVLSALEITPPAKTDYVIGDTLDTTGLVVEAVYSDGTRVTLNEGEYTLSASGEITQGGKVAITVTYENVTATFEINVVVSGTCGTDLTWVLDDGVLTITGTGAMTYYTDPEDAPWHAYAAQITQVNLPDGLTNINRNAFYGFSSLRQIEIPVGVTSVGAWSFRNCTSLESIIIPEGVQAINSAAFCDCSALTTVSLPSTLTSVSSDAFTRSALTQVNYAGSRTTKAAIAFGNNNSNLMNANWTYGRVDVTEIAVTALPTKTEYTVGEALDLTGMVVTATYDDDSTAPVTGYETTALTATEPGTATITVTYEGKTATFEVTVVKPTSGETENGLSWSIVEGVLTISGEGAMENYSAETPAPWNAWAADITAVVVEEGVTAIGENAFADCANVTETTIAKTVTAIGSGAFADCAQLATVTFGGTRNAWDALVAATENNAPLTAAEITCAVLVGDVNGDGDVNGKDVTVLLRYLAGQTGSYDLAAADINNDSDVNGKDVTLLLRQLAQ